ncbi:NAD(P)H-dependent oxidoreductase [Candidatus Bipolaricaulota bacterium]
MTGKRGLVLIGSPKGLEGSNSARHAQALIKTFDTEGWSLEWLHLHRAVESEEAIDDLLAKVDRSDQILFVAPLYVDSLPAPAIRALERIAAHRSGAGGTSKAPRFSVLLHCGFIEPKHNETAVEICRLFSEAAALEWFGELTLGGGGMPSRRVREALAEAGTALAKGFPIPPEARKRAKRPTMPRLAFILGGNLMWRRVAKGFGITKAGLLAQPYE